MVHLVHSSVFRVFRNPSNSNADVEPLNRRRDWHRGTNRKCLTRFHYFFVPWSCPTIVIRPCIENRPLAIPKKERDRKFQASIFRSHLLLISGSQGYYDYNSAMEHDHRLRPPWYCEKSVLKVPPSHNGGGVTSLGVSLNITRSLATPSYMSSCQRSSK